MAALFSAPDEDATLRLLNQLLVEAKEHFRKRDVRKAVAALHTAQATAAQHKLHREAAHLQRALTILAGGGRPKLLTQAASRIGEKEAE
jgi:hypothetical protein